MISADPPKRATWLLEHAGSRYRRESLAGDLIEEYRAGRSDAWYWRQVLWAIAASVGHAVRAVLPAWLALLTWWGVLLLFSFLWNGPPSFLRSTRASIGCTGQGTSAERALAHVRRKSTAAGPVAADVPRTRLSTRGARRRSRRGATRRAFLQLAGMA